MSFNTGEFKKRFKGKLGDLHSYYKLTEAAIVAYYKNVKSMKPKDVKKSLTAQTVLIYLNIADIVKKLKDYDSGDIIKDKNLPSPRGANSPPLYYLLKSSVDNTDVVVQAAMKVCDSPSSTMDQVVVALTGINAASKIVVEYGNLFLSTISRSIT